MKLRQYDDVFVVEPDDPEELIPIIMDDAEELVDHHVRCVGASPLWIDGLGFEA